MMWRQYKVTLANKARGSHLVTDEISHHLADLGDIKIGLAHFFLCHTSASLTINENADPTVRSDLDAYVNRLVPENAPYFEHTYEGPDDMPAHIKTSLFGNSLSIPISDGRLALGTWQGIYLCEHRNHGGQRRIIVTLQGEVY